MQECHLRLKRPTPDASHQCPPFKSSTAARSCSYGLFPGAALLRFAFGQEYGTPIFFSPKSNFKIVPEAAPYSSRSFSVSEKLARSGSSALSSVEHLRLLVGKDSMLTPCCGVSVLLRRCLLRLIPRTAPIPSERQSRGGHGGSLNLQCCDAEHALSSPLVDAEAIYRGNFDMKGSRQEVVHVVC